MKIRNCHMGFDYHPFYQPETPLLAGELLLLSLYWLRADKEGVGQNCHIIFYHISNSVISHA